MQEERFKLDVDQPTGKVAIICPRKDCSQELVGLGVQQLVCSGVESRGGGVWWFGYVPNTVVAEKVKKAGFSSSRIVAT